MKWRVLLVLVVASLILPPLTGSALGGAAYPRSSVGAESLSFLQAAQEQDENLPNCLRFTVDATSGVRLPPPRSYDMVFRIYSAPRRGRSLWKEDHEAVEVQADRSFSVLLGCAGSPLRPELWAGGPLWVEIQVIEDKPMDPLEPRIPLARVAFAYHSIQADEADRAESATQAGNAKSAQHADEADHATTAGFAADAAHAVDADHADEADHADVADSAGDAGNAKNAQHADTASYADNAGTAEEAVHAQDADRAWVASNASEATHAMNAENAAHADTAGYADRAGYADTAGTADEAVRAQVADTAREAASARTAGQADSAASAGYAERAGVANSAGTAGFAESAGRADFADSADDLMCTACVDEDELSFDPLTQEEFDQAGSPDDLVCTACVDVDELSFDPLTQEEFDQAGSPDDLVCTACVDVDELSFDPVTQQELDQPELEAALDGFQSSGGCTALGSDLSKCSATLDEVPEGKVFIIEHVSAWVQTVPGYDALVAFTAESGPVTPMRAWHFVDLEDVSASQPEAAKHFWVANHPTLAYADGQTSPQIECDVGEYGTCSVTVSGHLVDVQVDPRLDLQFTFWSAGDNLFNRSDILVVPPGFMAVIQHVSARVHLEDPADIAHTIGIQIPTEPYEEIPEHGTTPLPGTGGLVPGSPFLIPKTDPIEPEPPPDQPPVPDPDAGVYTYRLTPSLPPASPLLSYRTASEPVLAYVYEGMTLIGICGHTLSAQLDCEITVSGYLVELPPSP